MIRTAAITALYCALLCIGACRRAAPTTGGTALPSSACTPDEYGFSSALAHTDVVERGLAMANGVLDPQLQLQLSAGWRSTDGPRAISTYLIDGELSAYDTAFSPPQRRCIFISSQFLARLVTLFGAESDATFEVAPDAALGLILLHEIGHFVNGDVHGYAEPQPLVVDRLSIDLAQPLNSELRADQFAGAQLQRALQAGGDRMTAAMPLIFTTTHVSMNLLHHRLVDNFGATSLGLPRVFADLGYSHPNMELRFLIINYASMPEDRRATASLLISEFVARRQEKPVPLWRAP